MAVNANAPPNRLVAGCQAHNDDDIMLARWDFNSTGVVEINCFGEAAHQLKVNYKTAANEWGRQRGWWGVFGMKLDLRAVMNNMFCCCDMDDGGRGWRGCAAPRSWHMRMR